MKNIPEKWKLLSKDKYEREYKGFQLVVQYKPANTKKFDSEEEFDLWKWFVLKNNLVVEYGYEDSFEEATKTAEFTTRELTYDEQ